jgi:ATP-binding cassette subfamily B protein RaxB
MLFLDEATSHLDGDNENQINLAIKSLKMTKVLVAHRKETILSCDYIYELKNNLLLDVTSNYKKYNGGSTNHGELKL